MKTINILIIIASFLMTYCSSPEAKNKTESEQTQTEESPPEEEKAEESRSLINPNLASEEELGMVNGLNAEIISGIIKNRPFLTMMDLHSMLSEQLDTDQLGFVYQEMFVKMDLNNTPEEDFKLIPGVGDRMAHEFEEYRPYTSYEQFRREIGKYVDENEVARLEQYIFVPVELNTASKEMILAIPGVGKRMLHEFEEYRPYTSMEQFRKEIGKYVDESELARLERFVYLK